jgi:hypothetical protein
MKEVNNNAIFAIGRFINCRTQHKSFCGDKNKDYLTSYVMVYKAMSRVTLTRTRDLSPDLPLVAEKRGSLRE